MNRYLMQPLRWVAFAVALCAMHLQRGTFAEPIPVHHIEGTVHGFLVLRSQDGHRLAVGDLIQLVRGDRITSSLIFRFRDGSVDEENAVFSQRGNFQLISDHHVQKGPSFPHPMDLSIDVRRGQITVRSTGKEGKEEVRTEHMDLPSDLSNGMLLSLVKNIRPDAPETKVSMIVATPKPRLVKLAISPNEEEPFSLAGSHRKATRYAIKVELGGVTGVIAPLIGKAPPDIHMWIVGGKAPAFVKEEGELYEGGPIWSIELTSPVWPGMSKSDQ
jgi:hypothetical protein